MAVPIYFFDEHQNKLATGAQCCCMSIPLREGFQLQDGRVQKGPAKKVLGLLSHSNLL
jgi:hypothetical protein